MSGCVLLDVVSGLRLSQLLLLSVSLIRLSINAAYLVRHWPLAFRPLTPKAFQIATLDPDPDSAQPVHVRTQIFREFVTPPSKPSLPLLITSTDIRSPKVVQISANNHVELAWWIEPTKEQFRISGVVHLIPEPGTPLHEHYIESVDNAKESSGMRFVQSNSFGLVKSWPKNISA